jgi:hypothetical protein
VNIPVVVIGYNRPDLLQALIDRLRKFRPRRVFLIADGPRPAGNDAEQCRLVRQVFDQVDWTSDVHADFAERNLGLARRVISGLDNVFSRVDRAIILEDDCLPAESFFPFAEELLNRFEEESRVMAVAGTSYDFGRVPGLHSYHFSKYPHWWGWATWARAWKLLDRTMDAWPVEKASRRFRAIFEDESAYAYWERRFDAVREGRIDSWAGRWTYSCWRNDGIAAVPNRNLVTNVGYGPRATHTKARTVFLSMPTASVPFPLIHPERIEVHGERDRFTERLMFHDGRFRSRLNAGIMRARIRIGL